MASRTRRTHALIRYTTGDGRVNYPPRSRRFLDCSQREESGSRFDRNSKSLPPDRRSIFIGERGTTGGHIVLRGKPPSVAIAHSDPEAAEAFARWLEPAYDVHLLTLVCDECSKDDDGTGVDDEDCKISVGPNEDLELNLDVEVLVVDWGFPSGARQAIVDAVGESGVLAVVEGVPPTDPVDGGADADIVGPPEKSELRAAVESTCLQYLYRRDVDSFLDLATGRADGARPDLAERKERLDDLLEDLTDVRAYPTLFRTLLDEDRPLDPFDDTDEAKRPGTDRPTPTEDETHGTTDIGYGRDTTDDGGADDDEDGDAPD